MNDHVTAPAAPEQPSNRGAVPPAFEPARVLILDEEEQGALNEGHVTRRLWSRVAQGERFANTTDEYVRKTLQKRRLEAEVRKLNGQLADLETGLVEEWMEVGRNKDGHEATGATLSLRRQVRAKLAVDADGLSKQDAEQHRAVRKAEVGNILTRMADELGDLCRWDFNLNSLSAVLSERVKEYDEQQKMLPEHERVPKAPEEFLPDELRGLLVIDATPQIRVTA